MKTNLIEQAFSEECRKLLQDGYTVALSTLKDCINCIDEFVDFRKGNSVIRVSVMTDLTYISETCSYANVKSIYVTPANLFPGAFTASYEFIEIAPMSNWYVSYEDYVKADHLRVSRAKNQQVEIFHYIDSEKAKDVAFRLCQKRECAKEFSRENVRSVWHSARLGYWSITLTNSHKWTNVDVNFGNKTTVHEYLWKKP